MSHTCGTALIVPMNTIANSAILLQGAVHVPYLASPPALVHKCTSLVKPSADCIFHNKLNPLPANGTLCRSQPHDYQRCVLSRASVIQASAPSWPAQPPSSPCGNLVQPGMCLQMPGMTKLTYRRPHNAATDGPFPVARGQSDRSHLMQPTAWVEPVRQPSWAGLPAQQAGTVDYDREGWRSSTAPIHALSSGVRPSCTGLIGTTRACVLAQHNEGTSTTTWLRLVEDQGNQIPVGANPSI
jgi:hypothetical protein